MSHSFPAQVRIFLLEKVRVVTQTEGERGFHAFYLALARCGVETDLAVESCCVCGSSCGVDSRRDGVRDADAYDDASAAFGAALAPGDRDDAFGIAVYAAAFDDLVAKINGALAAGAGADGASAIGLLDIFGFEVFGVNSLEQLLINYANEQLQSVFNDFIFELEREEYAAEGVPFDDVDFPDNADVLALIEGAARRRPRRSGAGRARQAQGRSLSAKLRDAFGGEDTFLCDARRARDGAFAVVHYAGAVEYAVDGRTLAARFKASLGALLGEIRATRPHFVRCLKPNDDLAPDVFDAPRLLQQLRYCGVLAAVEVARAGYPVRVLHEPFVARYYNTLMPVSVKPPADAADAAKRARELVATLRGRRVCLGKRKVFLTMEAYEALEEQRAANLFEAAARGQALVRRAAQRVRFARAHLHAARARARAPSGRGRRASKSRAALLASKRDVERLEAECEALRREPVGELEKLRRENEALRERLAATEAYGAAFKHAHQRRQILDDAVPVVREVVEESDDVFAGCFFNYSIFGASGDDGEEGARGVDTVALQADAPEYALANHVDDGDACRRSRGPTRLGAAVAAPVAAAPQGGPADAGAADADGAANVGPRVADARRVEPRPGRPRGPRSPPRAASTPPGPAPGVAARRDDHETVVLLEDHVVETRGRRRASAWDLAANPCQPDAVAPPDPVAAPPRRRRRNGPERSLDDDAIANYLDGVLSPSQDA
ncbi:hypothetical protein JL720_12548 [Aureococcus anophagefferens]|nr:hypothetical protein JL720_12548 [Aureococcus anophagefferens]